MSCDVLGWGRARTVDLSLTYTYAAEMAGNDHAGRIVHCWRAFSAGVWQGEWTLPRNEGLGFSKFEF